MVALDRALSFTTHGSPEDSTVFFGSLHGLMCGEISRATAVESSQNLLSSNTSKNRMVMIQITKRSMDLRPRPLQQRVHDFEKNLIRSNRSTEMHAKSIGHKVTHSDVQQGHSICPSKLSWVITSG